MSSSQQALALNAVAKLRAELNLGSCQTIFDEGTPFFRRESQPEWASQCLQMKEQLGAWQGFTSLFAVRCGGPDAVVCLVGPGVFSNESKTRELAWSLQNGPPTATPQRAPAV